MLSLTPSFRENLEASLIFWLADMLLIVIALPVALAYRDRRRWRSMRKQMA